MLRTQTTIDFPARKGRGTRKSGKGSSENDLAVVANVPCDRKGKRSAGRGTRSTKCLEEAAQESAKENSPRKRSGAEDIAPVLLSPSKRPRSPLDIDDSELSERPAFNYLNTPVKSLSTRPSSVENRVPLSPRHANIRNLPAPLSPPALLRSPLIHRDVARLLSPKAPCTPKGGMRVEAPPKTPCDGTESLSDRVLRSASKKEAESPRPGVGITTSPVKVRRNLCDSFTESSETVIVRRTPSVSVLKLAREHGLCYERARSVLHTALPDMPLVCRDKEATQVATFLDNHVTGCRPGSLYVSGAPGTGKTAVLSKAIQRLRGLVRCVQTEAACRVVYVNCMSSKNAQSIYNSILSSLGGGKEGEGEGDGRAQSKLACKQARTAVEEYLHKTKTCTVLVLDEIDSLDSRSQEVLYTIFEWPSLPGSALVLVGVANSLDLTDRTLPRLQARPNCRPQLLHFPPYTKDQIVAVLEARFAQLNGETVFERAAVQLCARKVSSMSGDVRVAIDICRRAVEAVEGEARKQLVLSASSGILRSPSKHPPPAPLEHKKVGVAQVMKIVGEVYGNRLTSSASSAQQQPAGAPFPLQQTLCICTLLLLLRAGRAKEITLGKFHESYSRVCKRSGVNQIDQSEFLSLCSLIEARGIMALKKARDTRSIKASLRMDEKELEAAMQDRTLMSSILEKGLC